MRRIWGVYIFISGKSWKQKSVHKLIKDMYVYIFTGCAPYHNWCIYPCDIRGSNKLDKTVSTNYVFQSLMVVHMKTLLTSEIS